MKIAIPRLWYCLRYSVDGDIIILFLKFWFGVCRRPIIMYKVFIMPSKGVAIVIHPWNRNMPVDIIGIDKIATSHFLLKAIAIAHAKLGYVLASGITYNAGEWTNYVTSAFSIFLHKIINTIIIAIIEIAMQQRSTELLAICCKCRWIKQIISLWSKEVYTERNFGLWLFTKCKTSVRNLKIKIIKQYAIKLYKKSNYEFILHIHQVISQLVCEIIGFYNIIWGFISLCNEHGIMQPLAPDVFGISKTLDGDFGQLVNSLR